jgi:hypothetical protein
VGNQEPSSWVTEAALRWLELVLCERFGCRIELRELTGNTLQMRVRDTQASLTFALSPEIFCHRDSTLPYTSWDAAAEGWRSPSGVPLHAPGVRELRLPLISIECSGYHIGYDILGLTFWMLCRQEEIGRTDLDEHGRFPSSASHAFKHAYLESPIVDEWFNVLGQVMRRVWSGLPLREPVFQLKLTHDVDSPSRYGCLPISLLLRNMAGDAIKRRDLRAAINGVRIWLNSRHSLSRADSINTFDWIMSTSERMGIASAFYFLCGRTDPSRDGCYEIEHPAIRALLRDISRRGHEIGLHGSYNSLKRQGQISDEAGRLLAVTRQEGIEQPLWGGRMHYLRWLHPSALHEWCSAGLNYDSTLAYADRPGFRCGTCFEYPAFDPVLHQQVNVRIRPLIAMECTVIAPRYLGLGLGDQALERFVRLKHACKSVHGTFTLLWHNTELVSPQQRSLYEAVLSS